MCVVPSFFPTRNKVCLQVSSVQWLGEESGTGEGGRQSARQGKEGIDEGSSKAFQLSAFEVSVSFLDVVS